MGVELTMVRSPTEWGGGGCVELTMVRSPIEWSGGGCSAYHG